MNKAALAEWEMVDPLAKEIKGSARVDNEASNG